ncbi:MAG: hypothetical protein H6621_07710 [Halobacteriovoraceae bacterium]|nr:hypothetical protein [Halobacteriovoraceae bacterium]
MKRIGLATLLILISLPTLAQVKTDFYEEQDTKKLWFFTNQQVKERKASQICEGFREKDIQNDYRFHVPSAEEFESLEIVAKIPEIVGVENQENYTLNFWVSKKSGITHAMMLLPSIISPRLERKTGQTYSIYKYDHMGSSISYLTHKGESDVPKKAFVACIGIKNSY